MSRCGTDTAKSAVSKRLIRVSEFSYAARFAQLGLLDGMSPVQIGDEVRALPLGGRQVVGRQETLA